MPVIGPLAHPIEAHAPRPLCRAPPPRRSSLNHLQIPPLIRHQRRADPNHPASLVWDLYDQPNLGDSGPLLHGSSSHLLRLPEVSRQDVNPLELDDTISEPRSVGRWNICWDFEEEAEQSHVGTSSPYGEGAFTRDLCPHGHFQCWANGLDAHRRRGRAFGQYQESEVARSSS